MKDLQNDFFQQIGASIIFGFFYGAAVLFLQVSEMVEENTKPVAADSIPYTKDANGNESLKFIEDNSVKPFFISVSFNAHHTPRQVNPEKTAKI